VGRDVAFTQAKPSAKVLDEGDMAALFGLEMAENADAAKPISIARTAPKRNKPPAVKNAAAAKKKRAETKTTKHLGAGGKIEAPLVRAPAKRRAS
jgi:hypothetical protein